MHPFQTFLFAGDFSKSSREAFRVASSLAREQSTRLVVLHVVEPPTVPGELNAALAFADVSPAQLEAMRDQLREVYVPNHPIVVEYWTRVGHPAEEILRVAGELRCHLIIMGTHGRTGLARLLAGSVAETVMRKANCPVLTVRSTLPPTPPADVKENRVIVSL